MHGVRAMGPVFARFWLWLRVTWCALRGHSILVVTADRRENDGMFFWSASSPMMLMKMGLSVATEGLSREGYLPDYQMRQIMRQQLREMVNAP